MNEWPAESAGDRPGARAWEPGDAVCERWNQPCDQQAMVLNVQVRPISMIGPTCIGIGMNCLADTQDTVYHFSSRLPLDSDRVYAVVGALGTKTGHATYVGLGVNATRRQQGIDNVSDDLLEGSAADYAAAVSDPDKFFVYYFARDCARLDLWAAGTAARSPRARFRTITRRIRTRSSSTFRSATMCSRARRAAPIRRARSLRR